MIVLDADDVLSAATTGECADALERFLMSDSGDAADADPERTFVRVPGGELIVMPSRVTGVPTVKLVSVATDPLSPGGRVKGVHVVFDAESLAATAMLDAAALTVRRTAAVSLVALRRLAAARADRLLLFGSGPQARAHLEAVAAEWPLAWVGVVSRDTSNADRFATRARTAYPEVRVEVVGAGRVADAVARAGIVVCATTSTAPVFEDGALVDESCVVAVGSHRPDAREVPSSLVGRSYVVVEERATALREAGDVIVALDEGHLEAGDVVELGELVRGAAGEPGPGPRVFKSVGMAWEDAVVSALMVERSVR